MTKSQHENNGRPNKIFRHVSSKIYFSKKTERNFFFVLTLMMLVLGIVVKLELF